MTENQISNLEYDLDQVDRRVKKLEDMVRRLDADLRDVRDLAEKAMRKGRRASH